MSLAQKLEQVSHREVSGSDAYAAFEFQLMFGVELLFESYDQFDDYAVLFEFHDDIVLLTGTENPSSIEFFQLKHSTTGNWTLARLCSNPPIKGQSGGKAKSILQKLQGNVTAFSGYAKSAKVVSNTYYTGFGQAKEAFFDGLQKTDKEKIFLHIKAEFPSLSDDCLSLLGFRRSELDKTSCDDLVKGRIHTFLNRKLGGDAFQLDACVDAIVRQCRIRNKKLTTDVSGGAKDIVLQKGISRKDIENWLQEIAANKSAPEWSLMQPYIGTAWGFLEVNSIGLRTKVIRLRRLIIVMMHRMRFFERLEIA